MHVRLSSCIGLPVLEDSTGELVGLLSGMLLQPDSGKVEGFFIRIPKFFSGEDLFCSSADIVRWGARISVRSVDVLSPVEDRIRLLPLLEEGRTMLGQHIRTESGKELGVCKDVQFDTSVMQLEWLFPKRLFQWQLPVALSEIVLVTKEAIVVKDPPVAVEQSVLPTLLETLQDPAAS